MEKQKKNFMKSQKINRRNIKFKPSFCTEKTKINSERQRKVAGKKEIEGEIRI